MEVKERDSVEIQIEINVEAIRQSLTNASGFENALFSVPAVNPKKLNMDSIIYGFKSVPMNDKIKKLKNDDAKCIGIQEITVDNLSKTIKPGFIVVNGNYEMPIESGTNVKLDKLYVANKDHAMVIARLATEVELERALKVLAEQQEIVDSLQNQLDTDLY